MTPCEVRRRARAEHDSIRWRLARLDMLASRTLGGDGRGPVQELEGELGALTTELRGHLAWEDAEAQGARGDASWLLSSHDELRSVLDFCRHACIDENHPVLLAHRVRDLVELLRRELEAEEQRASESAPKSYAPSRRTLPRCEQTGASSVIGSDPADCLTELLSVDHRRLDDVLADVKRLLRAGETNGARKRFEVFREGLERHIEAEEQVLFPFLEDLTRTAQRGPTAVMRAEHTELRNRMAEVAGALAAEGADGLAAPLAALTARVYAHNGKEERMLYPMSDRLAREAGMLGELLGRLRQF